MFEKEENNTAEHWRLSVDGWTDLSESVKVSTSNFEECTMTLVVSEGEALLVDTGFEKPEAERVLDYIREHDLVLKHIVITHHHEDHDANLSLFPMNQGQVYDSEHLPEGRELLIGNKRVELLETPGHFPAGDISVHVVDEHILIAGDILYSCLTPQLSFGANPEILIPTLKELEKNHYKWIIPGHGKRILTGELMMTRTLSYIDKLFEKMQAVVSAQGTLEDVDKIELADCITHYDWLMEKMSLLIHHKNKRELFAKLPQE
jgi:glyoxylase-like metal-dependent hydrolase (beta-lactamase superfamily II)